MHIRLKLLERNIIQIHSIFNNYLYHFLYVFIVFMMRRYIMQLLANFKISFLNIYYPIFFSLKYHKIITEIYEENAIHDFNSKIMLKHFGMPQMSN